MVRATHHGRGFLMRSDGVFEMTKVGTQGTSPRFRLSVCADADLDEYCHRGVTHILSIDSSEFTTPTPDWFSGVHKHVFFHDVLSRAEADALSAREPTAANIREVLEYGRECLIESRAGPTHLIIHCTYGASRSPAAAYAILCLWLGKDREVQAKDLLLRIRPEAVPNILVIAHADKLLRREGKMVEAIQSLNDQLIEEMKQGHRA
jgi:predicted protein tyrosine phosphatase